MNYNVDTIESFDKQAKRLAKKYSSLKSELQELKQQLTENPEMGKPIGHQCYKIRLAITSKGKGKSGGGRVITFAARVLNTVYLLAIYDKSEQESLTDAELLSLLESVKTR